MATTSKTYNATRDIFRVILEESNGYSKEEIIKNKLAEDCDLSEYWDKIENILGELVKTYQS